MTRMLMPALAVLALVLPASASGATFCVHSPANCVGTDKPDLQAALDAADANGNAKDTIRLGVGLFDEGPAVDVAGNPVEIIGTAANKTAIRSSSAQAGLMILDIQEPTSTISDLRVHHNSAAPTATGIRLAGDADDVLVTNQGQGQFDGIRMVGGSPSIDESAVSLVYPANLQNRAVFVPAGADADVSDSYLEATVGVTASAGDASVLRTRIRAVQGVVASGGSTTSVRDTEIRVPGPFGSNFQEVALVAAGNGATTLEADRLTAHGDGSGFGLWVVPNDGAGNDAVIDLQGSVVDSFATDVSAVENNGSSATVAATRNAYDLSSTSFSGSVSYTQSQTLDLHGTTPGFLDAAAGNLRLRHDSPLIDQGDPAYAPFLGGLDVLSKVRVRDGDGAGGAVVDLGAHEYQRRAPAAAAQAAPQPAAPAQAIAFAADGSEDSDGDALTYEWSFDDGTTAGGASAQHAFAVPGQRTATVTVTDPTGLSGTATVTVDVEAPAQPGAGGQAPGPGLADARLSLTGLVLAPATFRARAPRRSRRARGAARRRRPVGTTVRFRLSSPARVTFAVDRALPGRRAGRTCRRTARANRAGRPCVRWVKAGGFVRAGRAGANARRFDGRLGGRALALGRYRLRARARDGDGHHSAPGVAKGFRIVAR